MPPRLARSGLRRGQKSDEQLFRTLRPPQPLQWQSGRRSGHVRIWPIATLPQEFMSAVPPILLQNSKVAGPQIFRKKTEREVIADSYNLNRITKVACEFVARR